MDNVRRRHGAIAVYGLLIACLLFVISSPTPTGAESSSCAALREWASSYAHAPVTLDQIVQFTRAQRVAVFSAVSPEVRASLWREQLQRFALRTDLTEEQRTFILKARADLSAATYSNDNSLATRREEARKFWRSAAPLFPSPEHQRAWFILGALSDPPLSSVVAPRAPLSSVAASGYPDCECSAGWGDIECYPGTCNSPQTCVGSWNCGPQGRDECISMCQY